MVRKKIQLSSSVQTDEDQNKCLASKFIFIFIQANWQALLCLSDSSQKTVNHKKCVYTEQSDSCGKAITFNKKKENEHAEEGTICLEKCAMFYYFFLFVVIFTKAKAWVLLIACKSN